MDAEPIAGTRTTILRPAAPIAAADDVLDLVAAAFEHDAHGILLDESCLPPAFFDLSTRFAGELVQKLLNYRLLVAAVLPGTSYDDRFREFVGEARTGRQFRTFADEASAVRWLDEAGAP